MADGQENVKFWQKGWVMWISLLFIPPVGMILCYLNRDKYPKWQYICGIAFIWFIIGVMAPGKTTKSPQPPVVETQQQKQTKAVEKKDAIQPKLAAFPESLDDVASYIKSSMDDKYKNKTTVDVSPSTNTPGGYLVEITTGAKDLNLEQSKNLARNIIVAVYDAVYEKNLPVVYVSYRTYPNENEQDRMFILGIGKNVADKAVRGKWNIHTGNSFFSVDEFIGFARSNLDQAITADGKTHFENRCFMH